jgi:3-hydroxyisobutyryl-CoA hydrolase
VGWSGNGRWCRLVHFAFEILALWWNALTFSFPPLDQCNITIGISIHGKYRVATENTMFAMPETAIGLFPDVGSMFWMNRLLTKPMANYLGLTGKRIKASDLIHVGLATHYVPSKDLPDLERALVDATNKDETLESEDVVASVLMSFHETIATDDSFLSQTKDLIEKSFSANTLEDIVSNLEQDGSGFGQATLQTINKMSPTSLKLTLEGLKRGAACETIGEDLQMEYRMAKACSRSGSDFFEGVRAVLVDKDHQPRWSPDSLEGVTDEMVESFFAPVEDELVIHKVQQPSKL